MRIATWNVNSLRVRLEIVVDWLIHDGPDVVCLQETKATDEVFPVEPLAAAGYQAVFTGQKTYNGVAILSRLPLTDVVRALPEAPGEDEKRFIAATVGGLRVINVYVPNGQAVDSPKFYYKLAWLERLRTYLATTYTTDAALVLCGDFNVAPEPRDVYDAEKVDGEILFHPAERAAFARLLAWGLRDTLRLHHQEGGLVQLVGLPCGGVSARPGVPHRPYPGDATGGSTLYRGHPGAAAAPLTPAIGSYSRGGDIECGGGVGHCSVWYEVLWWTVLQMRAETCWCTVHRSQKNEHHIYYGRHSQNAPGGAGCHALTAGERERYPQMGYCRVLARYPTAAILGCRLCQKQPLGQYCCPT